MKYPQFSQLNEQQDPAEGLQILVNELCEDDSEVSFLSTLHIHAI